MREQWCRQGGSGGYEKDNGRGMYSGREEEQPKWEFRHDRKEFRLNYKENWHAIPLHHEDELAQSEIVTPLEARLSRTYSRKKAGKELLWTLVRDLRRDRPKLCMEDGF